MGTPRGGAPLPSESIGPRSLAVADDGRGAFCPRGARKIHRAIVLVWVAGGGVTLFTAIYYLARLEPSIRAFDATFADRFTAIVLVMLALGFGMIPLQTAVSAQPDSVTPTPEGLRLTHRTFVGSRVSQIPWDGLRALGPVERPSGTAPGSRFIVSIARRRRSLLTYDVVVESDVIAAWEALLPDRLRQSPSFPRPPPRGGPVP